MDYPKTKYGVGIGLFRGKSVYLSQRMWNQLHYSNVWQIVYGSVKSDYERYADAAVRVVKEPTGLNIDVSRFCYIKSILVGLNEFYYIYFVHLKDDEQIRPVTMEELAIRSNLVPVPLDEAVLRTLVPGLEKILRRALISLRKSETVKVIEKAIPPDDSVYSCLYD